jgi:peptide-methionine (S)-S-oxide reductase
VTQIDAAPTIFPAEDYHQNYFVQHPNQGYCMAVVAPKLAKFRAKFKALIAPQYS